MFNKIEVNENKFKEKNNDIILIHTHTLVL